MDNLFNVLSKQININLIIRSIILTNTTVKSYKKSEKILQQGDIVTKLFFNEKGIIRKSIDRNGKNITLHYIQPGNFFTCIQSLNPDTETKNCQYNFELITPGQILSTDFSTLYGLVKKFPTIKRVYDKVIQDYYLREEQRAIDLQSLSATERYHNFITEFPDVLEHAKMMDIASLLGINQETLSRIRKKLK
jgi:CRP/FNR family transcriptional regulator, anaerobic regulatory protein